MSTNEAPQAKEEVIDWSSIILGGVSDEQASESNEPDTVRAWIAETMSAGEHGLAIEGLAAICADRKDKPSLPTPTRNFYIMIGAFASMAKDLGGNVSRLDIPGLKSALGITGHVKGE